MIDGVVRELIRLAGDDSQISISSRDVVQPDASGVPSAWVEVLIRDQTGNSAHACPAVFAPILALEGEGRPRIELSRRPGRGSFALMLLPGLHAPCAVAHEPPSPEPMKSDVLARAASASPLLLVADDDELFRHSVSTAMRDAGYRVLEAANGVEALKLLDQQGATPDLVITDVLMPRMSGIELARRLSERHPGSPFLLMSGLEVPGGVTLPGRVLPKRIDVARFCETLLATVGGILGAAPGAGKPQVPVPRTPV